MRLRPDTALTFDDVLLVPRRSAIRSRQAVNTRASFSRRIEVAIPLIIFQHGHRHRVGDGDGHGPHGRYRRHPSFHDRRAAGG
jgi:hypothetical protein